ncbi:MAG TPA: hypothetical protein VIW07_18045 [Candidatus Udaeobacter sp.]
MKELQAAEKSGTPEDQYFWRRVVTRAVFSAIEGSCELMRRQAFVAELNKLKQNFVHPLKLTALSGKTCYVTDEGEIRIQDSRIPFLGNVLLSLKSYEEAQGVSYRTKKGDQWSRIQNGVQVRHRITHPKNLAGLAISNEEMVDIEFAIKWFLDEVENIFREKGVEIPPRVF